MGFDEGCGKLFYDLYRPPIYDCLRLRTAQKAIASGANMADPQKGKGGFEDELGVETEVDVV